MAKNEKYKSQNHMILLYPDNESHLEALAKIEKSYDYLGIIHDRDYWTEKDEKKDSKHKAGELKKKHIHIVIREKNQRWNTAICKELGIDTRFIENVSNFERSLQYLIHLNDSDKAEYNIEETFGTLQNRLIESINKANKTEGEKVSELIEYIENQNEYITIKSFAKYCAINGYWAEFRRSGTIFCKMLEEHNSQFVKK